MFVYATCTEYNMLQCLAGSSATQRFQTRSLEICTMADVVVLNLCTMALQILDCRVLSGNNNHNKFILF